MGGVPLERAQLSNSGFEYDRYWMLINKEGRFFTQRDAPKLALFKVRFAKNGILVEYGSDQVEIPFSATLENKLVPGSVWQDELQVLPEAKHINDWFSAKLQRELRLVRVSPKTNRKVKDHPQSGINFPDSNQYLIIGESSLERLNSQLDEALKMNRFRPNIVFSGGKPHEEDTWRNILIKDSTFEYTKLCSRCKMITIDQESGKMGMEPSYTLSRYRRIDNKIKFGSFWKLIKSEDNTIAVGDEIVIA